MADVRIILANGKELIVPCGVFRTVLNMAAHALSRIIEGDIDPTPDERKTLKTIRDLQFADPKELL